MTHDLILGTAGHIDHGKTSLIRALTGTETDRLPEERKRGITIELGFAQLQLGDFRLGIVDVPGHERFVRNMLAGATGMDLAMLVVAADDSIKQQTREHLDILRMLRLRRGLIALTKIDLVEPDWLELVEEEIGQLVEDTFLASCPIVPVSAKTGQGVETLRDELKTAASQAANEGRSLSKHAPFRMAIDRTFTIAGHGTVVTGSVVSGTAAIGERLMIQPSAREVRVRGLQNHDATVDSISRGQRAAINLSGVHHDETERGQELCAPGYLVPSRILNVELQLLKDEDRELKDRKRVRLHVGTAEFLATVRLLDKPALQPGESGFAQLFLQRPAVTTWGQPIVIRSESPVRTIGGGQVLHPDAERLRTPSSNDLRQLLCARSDDASQRASAALYFAGRRGWDPDELPRTAGVEETEPITEQLKQSGDLVELPISPTRVLRIHQLHVAELSATVTSLLSRLHDQFPLRSQLPITDVRKALNWITPTQLLDYTLNSLRAAKSIRLNERGIGLAGRGPKLSQNEQKLLTQLVEDFEQAKLSPPTPQDCVKRAAKNKESVPQLLQLAVANGDLIEIAPDLMLHEKTEQDLREAVIGHLQKHPSATVSEIKDLLETTRKYAVPFCEYLDRMEVTQRAGDARVLNERFRKPQESNVTTE